MEKNDFIHAKCSQTKVTPIYFFGKEKIKKDGEINPGVAILVLIGNVRQPDIIKTPVGRKG